ncbi:hypothetical protein [Nocardia sp. NPDC051570]|uniref:hypothetical protein n=1 Tax=Nocardia sp. NPDC051570 TaxID=3364324 RepID=UPI0037A35C03
MEINDDGRIIGLLQRGAMTATEAESMRRCAPIQRNLVDSLLYRLCMQPLSEAAENLFVGPFRSYTELLQREPQAAVQEVPTSVAAVLAAAADGYTLDNCLRRADYVLRTLGGPSESDRGCALALHTRVAAARIRDGVTAPIVGIDYLAWPLEHDRDPRTPEIDAINEGARLRDQWIEQQTSRSQAEVDILALAHTVSWPATPPTDATEGHAPRG